MLTHQASVNTETADRELAGIGPCRVPLHWPAPDPAPAGEPAGSGAGAAGPGWAGTGEGPWPQQFAVLLAETLTGARPVKQVLPWLSRRGSAQLHRLRPVLRAEHRPRVLRVLPTMPGPDVIEMTMVVLVGPRARALAVRLERVAPEGAAEASAGLAGQWLCTDIEAG